MALSVKDRQSSYAEYLFNDNKLMSAKSHASLIHAPLNCSKLTLK
jgi:hypothetical protein